MPVFTLKNGKQISAPELDEMRADGYETGRTWTAGYRPGGPFVYADESFGQDVEWSAFCKHSAECCKAWLEGFDAGRLTRERATL